MRILSRSNNLRHLEVGEYLVVVCRHFGVEPNEPNLNKKVRVVIILSKYLINTIIFSD